MSKLASQITTRRKVMNLAIREVCRRAGLQPSVLSRVEAGKITPTMITLMKLSKVLDLDLNTLVRFTTQLQKRRKKKK